VVAVGPSRVPAAWGPAPARPSRAGVSAWSWAGGGGPEEAGELAGDGDRGHVVRLAAFAQALVLAVEAVLGAPGDLQDVIGLARLAVVERDADPRRAA